MLAFIGLGNVGEKYKNTKHNAGFWIMDEMAARHKISFSPGRGDYVIASKLDKLHLVKPITGMNRRGDAVSQLVKSKNILTLTKRSKNVITIEIIFYCKYTHNI